MIQVNYWMLIPMYLDLFGPMADIRALFWYTLHYVYGIAMLYLKINGLA